MKGQYIADLFCGHGGVARALEKLGFACKSFDIINGQHQDLCSRKVKKQLKQDAQRGKLRAAMLGPPCTSFSVARDRTAVIRTQQFPWGLQNVSEKDREKLDIGNACMKAAIELISFFHKLGIPWILEHPASSKAWYLPELRSFLGRAYVYEVTCDFCQYGTAWRKRTRLLCGHCDGLDLVRISKMCSGRGVCSRTRKPHLQLTGSSPQGVPWTRVAQPYPPKLCHDLAFVLTAPLRD